jgi:hypothetical protein
MRQQGIMTAKQGETPGVGANFQAMNSYYCVFLQQWTQILIPKTTSSRRPHPSRA